MIRSMAGSACDGDQLGGHGGDAHDRRSLGGQRTDGVDERAVPTRSTASIRSQVAMVGEMPAAWATIRCSVPWSRGDLGDAGDGGGVADVGADGSHRVSGPGQLPGHRRGGGRRSRSTSTSTSTVPTIRAAQAAPMPRPAPVTTPTRVTGKGRHGRRGTTATEGMLADDPQPEEGVDHPDQLVHLEQRPGDVLAGQPDRCHLGHQVHVPVGVEPGHGVPLAAGAVADGDPGEPDLGVLGLPRLDQLVQRRLAHGVGAQSRPRWCVRRADRRQVGGGALRLGQVGEGRRGDQRGSDHVGVEDPPPGLGVGVGEPHQGPDAGGVDQRVDAAELAGGFLDRRSARRLVGHVAGDGHRVRAGLGRRHPPAGPCVAPSAPPAPRAAPGPPRCSDPGHSMLRPRPPSCHRPRSLLDIVDPRHSGPRLARSVRTGPTRSGEHHREALPTPHRGGPGLLGILPVDLPGGEALEHLVEGHPALEPGQRGAEAEVEPVAEGQMVVDRAGDVEAVAVGELAGRRGCPNR